MNRWFELGLPLSGLALIVVFGARLYFRQQSLVFRPRPESHELSPADLGIAYRNLYLDCADGARIHGWWTAGERGKAIIYFHGSDGNLAYELSTLRFLRHLGPHVLLIDYPGYGRSSGRCSERSCYEAAEAAWRFIRERQDFRAEDVVLFGRSLGSAVATYLAATRECGGLVFQSGFTSVPDMAALTFPYVPVRLFCRTQMDSLHRITQCTCPVLVLHSPIDEQIPVAQALRVYGKAPGPKQFVPLRGPHGSTEWQRDAVVLRAWEELISRRVADWEQDVKAMKDRLA